MRPPNRSGKRLAPSLAACILIGMAWSGGLAAAPADAATDEKQRLQQLKREIETGHARQKKLERKKSRLDGEVRDLQSSLVGTAAAVQDHESQVTALEIRLEELAEIEAQAMRDLERRKVELSATLGALTRLSRRPPQAMILSPAAAGDTVRTSLVLRTVVPSIKQRAESLRAQLVSLRDVRREIARDRSRLDQAGRRLTGKKRELERLFAYKATERARTIRQRDAERRRLARMAAQARDLSDLLRRLEKAEAEAQAAARAAAEREAARRKPSDGAGSTDDPPATSVITASLAPPPQYAFSAARGRLPLPVRGRMIGRFGEREGSGNAGKGITIETRFGAAVVAPNDGKVVFSGPFRGYGELLIISLGEGYHILLAGLGRTDVSVGQWLLAGEPVGLMAEAENGADPGQRPNLYIELRHRGEPINPLPWMTADKRKVSG